MLRSHSQQQFQLVPIKATTTPPLQAGSEACLDYHDAECSGQPLHAVLSMHGVFGIALIQPSATLTDLFNGLA